MTHHEPKALRDQVPTAVTAVRAGWLFKSAIAGMALLLGVGYFWIMSPKTWWGESGFTSNPGDFIRRNNIDYAVCSPWEADAAKEKKKTPGIAAGEFNVVQRKITLAPDVQTNVGILLPKTAKVAKIYCGGAIQSGAMQECTLHGCTPPVTATLDDDLYTSGRALQFTLRNNARKKTPDGTMTLWVVWK